MRRRIVIGLILGLALGAVALWPSSIVCDPRPSPAKPGATAPLPDADRLPPLPAAVAEALRADDGFAVAWAAHAGGRLEPCGCSAGMHGGLVRRAALLTRVDRSRVLVVEGGGWHAGSADYQLVRSESFLDGLAQGGCDVVALGNAEGALDAAKLRRLVDHAQAAGLPVVSANLLDADGRTMGRPFATITTAGRRHALTAVSESATGPGLTVGDAVESVLAVQRATHDPLIVIADLDEDGLTRLARAVPGLYAVIGGAVKQPSPAPLKVGACRVVFAANEGKTLGWWLPAAEVCAYELITETVPDHPAMRALVHRYQERVAAMDIQLDERIAGLTTLGTAANGAAYAGSQACQPCHQQESAKHGRSGHATALASLERRNYHRDPDCLRCHVTGLGLKDGWNRKVQRSGLAEVGCESCHGRGSLHIAEHQQKTPSSGSLTPVTPATCRRCHDAENSPRFEYPAYWRMIAHGRK